MHELKDCHASLFCHVDVGSVINYDRDFHVAVGSAYASVVIAVLTAVGNKFLLLIACIFNEIMFYCITLNQWTGYMWEL
jgi:hypothetical protein